MEKFRKKKDFHKVFIDLEKAYDRVLKGIIWQVLENKGVSIIYIDIVKDMDDVMSKRLNKG